MLLINLCICIWSKTLLTILPGGTHICFVLFPFSRSLVRSFVRQTIARGRFRKDGGYRVAKYLHFNIYVKLFAKLQIFALRIAHCIVCLSLRLTAHDTPCLHCFLRAFKQNIWNIW